MRSKIVTGRSMCSTACVAHMSMENSDAEKRICLGEWGDRPYYFRYFRLTLKLCVARAIYDLCSYRELLYGCVFYKT